jgi:cytochrome c oxidase subunit II
MMPKTKRAAGLVVAALTATVVAAACGSGSSSYSTSNPSGASASPQASSSGTAGTLRVEQLDYRFQPQQLTGMMGKAVTVEIVNSGGTAHTFTIDGLGVDQTLDPGQSATVTFTPTRAGTFTFYCRFHRSSGMTGSLIVSGGSSSSSASPSPASSGAGSNGGYGGGY